VAHVLKTVFAVGYYNTVGGYAHTTADGFLFKHELTICIVRTTTTKLRVQYFVIEFVYCSVGSRKHFINHFYEFAK